MCGIASVIGKDTMDIFKMIPKIKHRGKDGHGIHYETGKVALAHTRLSLVGDMFQPMINDKYIMVANCEVYNHKELRHSIRYDLKTDSDAEVLFAGVTTQGIKFLNKVNGDFAFILYDRKTGEMTMCRDRYGIRQLFYHMKDGRITHAASDVKTLLSVIDPVIDMKAMAINFRYKVSPKPVFENIYKVGAGEVIVVRQNGTVKERNKWYTIPEKDYSPIPYNSILEESEYLIRDSLALRMHHEGTALMLGGLDSSVLYQRHKGLTCYNLNGEDTSQAKSICPDLNVRSHHLEEGDIDNMIRCFEQPYYSFTPQYQIVKHIKEKVVISGLGPDEMLGGYHYYKEPYGLDSYKKQFTLFEQDLFDIKVPELFSEEKSSGYKTMNYHDITHYLAHHHLYRGDQDMMHFTKESRYPYLDHRIVEMWYNLPTEYKVGKRILRDIYGKDVKKNGFVCQSPTDEWINDNIASLEEKNILNLSLLKTKDNLPNKNKMIHLAMTNRFIELFTKNNVQESSGPKDTPIDINEDGYVVGGI